MSPTNSPARLIDFSLEERKELQERLEFQKEINNCQAAISLIEEEKNEVDSDEDNQSSLIMNCSCRARILVVDDTDFNILAVQLMIRDNFNFEIESAPNGLVAVEMFKEGYNRPCKC